VLDRGENVSCSGLLAVVILGVQKAIQVNRWVRATALFLNLPKRHNESPRGASQGLTQCQEENRPDIYRYRLLRRSRYGGLYYSSGERQRKGTLRQGSITPRLH
jgi:hypothetical protein